MRALFGVRCHWRLRLIGMSVTIMENREFESRLSDVKGRAEGRWTSILESIGVDVKLLNKRNQPCPACGGTDRFQYTDKFHRGDYYCRGCGPGDGFKLAEMALGYAFRDVFKKVEEAVGRPVSRFAGSGSAAPSAQKMRKLARKIWEEAQPITAGDEVDRYLTHRGLKMEAYPNFLRYHPCLGYYVKEGGNSKKVGEYPAMIACVQGSDGLAITLHRTYLQDGQKARLPDVKKLLSAGVNGAAVRLFPIEEELAVAEGIEKSLAVHLATGKPVWPALSCGNMEKLWIPQNLKRLSIYGDNDANREYDGQAAAYALARRVKKDERRTGNRIQVDVYIPKQAGEDWEDVWVRRLARGLKAA